MQNNLPTTKMQQIYAELFLQCMLMHLAYPYEPILHNTICTFFVITWLYSDVFLWNGISQGVNAMRSTTVSLGSTGRSRSTCWAPLEYAVWSLVRCIVQGL